MAARGDLVVIEGLRADPDSCHDALAVAAGGHARSMLQRQAICLGCAELPGAQHCPGGRQLQIRRFFALAHIVIAPEESFAWPGR